VSGDGSTSVISTSKRAYCSFTQAMSCVHAASP
jgi:hypothetical protein